MSRLVAHRGQSLTMPENTIESISRAIDCGATAVEFDIQMTSDGIPVLSHDLSLRKTAGVDIKLTELQFDDLRTFSVNEAARFGQTYAAVRVPSLRQMVTLLQQAPQVMAFVELKDESIEVFGIEEFLKPVIAALEPVKHQCVLIADSLEALVISRKTSTMPIGWIIHRWDENSLLVARHNAIDYLIINHEYCAGIDHDYSADDWQWVMYETCDVVKANALFDLGVQFVETNDICAMLKQMPECN